MNPSKKRRFRLRSLFRLPIYPGGLWARRIHHLIPVLFICCNLFLDALQKHLLDQANQMVNNSEELAQKGEDAAVFVEGEVFTRWDALQAELPGFYNKLDNRFQLSNIRYNAEENIQTIRTYSAELQRYSDTLRSIGTIIKLLSYLVWLPIGYSVLWLLQDVLYAHRGFSRFIMRLLFVAMIPWNIWATKQLTQDMPKTIAVTEKIIVEAAKEIEPINEEIEYLKDQTTTFTKDLLE